MVECGFDHEALNQMTEREFNFWLGERLELDRIREVQRKEGNGE